MSSFSDAKLYELTRAPGLVKGIRLRRLRYFGHCVRFDDTHIVHTTLRCCGGGVVRRGQGARTTWRNNVERDMAKLNLEHHHALDKDLWRAVITEKVKLARPAAGTALQQGEGAIRRLRQEERRRRTSLIQG